jgi:type II secretory pathway pseudopilin PulG
MSRAHFGNPKSGMVANRRSRQGFLLIEVLVCIGLYLLAGALFIRLMRGTLRATDASRETATAVSQVDHLLNAIRRDVWQASEITLADPHSLILKESDSHAVIWKLGADNAVRQESTPVQLAGVQYRVGGVSAVQDGWGVIVTIPGSGIRGGGQICLLSQTLSQKEKQP